MFRRHIKCGVREPFFGGGLGPALLVVWIEKESVFFTGMDSWMKVKGLHFLWEAEGV